MLLYVRCCKVRVLISPVECEVVPSDTTALRHIRQIQIECLASPYVLLAFLFIVIESVHIRIFNTQFRRAVIHIMCLVYDACVTEQINRLNFNVMLAFIRHIERLCVIHPLCPATIPTHTVLQTCKTDTTHASLIP